MLTQEQQNEVVPTKADNRKAQYKATSANQLKFYNNASEDAEGRVGYFADINQAINNASEFIFIVNWSFHPTLRLQRVTGDDEMLGQKLVNKANSNPNMLIAIHTWDHMAAKLTTHDNDNEEGGDKLAEMNGGKRPDNLLWRASQNRVDTIAGVYNSSHHQKFVVLDAPLNEAEPDGPRVIKAFFGGIDLTHGRFDWAEHPLKSTDPAFYNITFKDDWYNGEFSQRSRFGDVDRAVREPWRDIHAQITGPVAWDFIYEFLGRWCGSLKGSMGDKDRVPRWPIISGKYYFENLVYDKVKSILRGSTHDGKKIYQAHEFVESEGGLTGPWRAQLLRSIHKDNTEAPYKLESEEDAGIKTILDDKVNWQLTDDSVDHSIQDAYINLINAADDFIYIENQYFMGSGSKWPTEPDSGMTNKVPQALVERIERARQEGREFHVYIVIPMYPEGDPSSRVFQEIRYWEWKTMEYMVKSVMDICTRWPNAQGEKSPSDWVRYLSFYHPANWSGVFTEEQREQLPVIEQIINEGTTNEKVVKVHDWRHAKLYDNSVTERVDKVGVSQRYMVYVHSKAMIVDDKYAIIGSANINDRSLKGSVDTEIAMVLWPGFGKEQEALAQLREFRLKAWEEHLGSAFLQQNIYGQPNSELNPGSFQCSELVSALGKHHFMNFMRGWRDPDEQGALVRWPVWYDQDNQLIFDPTYYSKVPNEYIPDYDENSRSKWRWVGAETRLVPDNITQ